MAVRVPPSVAPADDRRPSPYERLKQAILAGELAPGRQLVETPLAQWCQVSRTPVREALTRLEQDGLVLRTDRGLVVRERSPEEILDLYETRIVLEAAAARVAAARRSPIDVITMRRVADRLERLDTEDGIEMAAAKRDLHRALWRATHNESLIDLLTRIDLHLGRHPATTLSQPGRWHEANGEHRAIIDAIDAQDLDLAEKLATKHFTKARDLRLALWAADAQI
ncbi:GntR family transcriptional regulator [Streptosporangium subroseum]|uniref:GntR family transcriptional regulator n=1 Tax=Streptosporangium subroseum TaxID=106412 RepID=UPI0034262E74